MLRRVATANTDKMSLFPHLLPSIIFNSPSVGSKGRKRLESIEENTGTAYPVANQKKHVRNQSDEVSALSNGSWYSRDSSHLSKNQLERITNFERDQQDQFDRKKKDIGNKLSNALDQQIPSVRTIFFFFGSIVRSLGEIDRIRSCSH